VHLHRIYGVIVGASRPLPAAPASGAPDVVIHEHNFRRPSSLPANPRGYSYERLESGDIHVSWSELFDFIVSADGARIDVYAEPAPDTEPVYTYLISQVISVALLQLGIESLHASAVEMDGKAVILIGDSGYGKSTLTAALLRSGARLITDDLLVMHERDGAFDVAPGAFRLKLAPETAAVLGVDWKGVPMADGSGKLVYLLDPALCVSTPLPLDRMFLIEPVAPRAVVEDVSASDATRALLAATFNPLHTEPERLARLLRGAQKTARGTCIRRLHVPRDLDNISDVVSLI
jgi:hypothetical protein